MAASLSLAALVLACAPTPGPHSGASPAASGAQAPVGPFVFGSRGYSEDPGCLSSALATAAAACLERYEFAPTGLHVFVRALPHTTIMTLGCVTDLHCPSATWTIDATEPPPAGSPAGTMGRNRLTLPRPMDTATTKVCARDGSVGFQLPSPSPLAQYGCLPFREQVDPSGSVWVSVSGGGIVVDGWVIDPATDQALDVSLTANGTTVAAHADQDDTRSAASWPGFSTKHGFHAILPFDGTPGPHQVCVTFPNRVLANGTSSPGCAPYDETPTVFLQDTTYPVGTPVAYSVEMAGAGAVIRLNLLTSGFFLLPWIDSDVGLVTADGHGHGTGSIPTDALPPGRYAVAFICESGCASTGQPGGGTLGQVTIGGQSVTVWVAPSFTVAAPGSATIAVTAGPTKQSITIAGDGAPASAQLSVMLVAAIPRSEGLHVVETLPVTVDASGHYSVTSSAPGVARIPGVTTGLFVAYLLDAQDHALAATEFRP